MTAGPEGLDRNDMRTPVLGSRQLLCPRCQARIPISKLIFREEFRCGRCGTPLRVSANYSRALVLASELLSFALLWAAGIRNLWLFVLLLPLGFPILTILVRVAPYVVHPHLQTSEHSAFTKLDL